MQEIFNLRPLLGKAALTDPMSDLFQDLSVGITRSNTNYIVSAQHLLPGRTNYLQVSSDLITWTTFHTNVATNTISVVVPAAPAASQRFYRAIQR